MAKLVLLIWEAHVAMVSSSGGRTRGVGVGSDTRRGTSGQHARGDHRAARSWARPQIVGDLLVEEAVRYYREWLQFIPAYATN